MFEARVAHICSPKIERLEYLEARQMFETRVSDFVI